MLGGRDVALLLLLRISARGTPLGLREVVLADLF